MATIAEHGKRVVGAASAGFSASRRVINNPGIAQDNIIFAVLLFGFVVWITTKGELPTYLAFFKPGAGQGPAPVTVTASSTTGGATQSPAVNTAIGTVNNAINGTGLGSAITGLTGVNPLTLSTVPGSIGSGIVNGIGKSLTAIKGLFGGGS